MTDGPQAATPAERVPRRQRTSHSVDHGLPVDHVVFGTSDLAAGMEIVESLAMAMTSVGELQWHGANGSYGARATANDVGTATGR